MSDDIFDEYGKSFKANIYLKAPIVDGKEKIEVVVFYPNMAVWEHFIQKTSFLEIFYPAMDLDCSINTNNILAIERLG